MPVLTGTRLGPYLVHEQLGAGGMGEVYRATDTRLRRDVAIKILPAATAREPQHRARLRREAQLISALNHPHICGLHDLGEAEGVDYLVLELLQGHTLLTRLHKGAVPVAQVLHIGSQIAEGLAAAHRQGVIHRDLKPANVMLTPSGVKLLDFGLAKPLLTRPDTAQTLLDESPITAEASLVGTLDYMAPEQVQGEPVDTRTDIFALGVVLHEMVTGRKAFDGKNPASVIAKILDVDPPPVSALVPTAPRALDHVIGRCLAKNPDDRWQSVQDVYLQLEWLRSQMSEEPRHGERQALHHRAWLPLAAAGLGALAAIALLLYFLPNQSPAPSVSPLRFRVAVGDAVLEELDAPVLSPDGRQIAYAASRSGRRHLFVNDLRMQHTVVLPGTDGARFPFWGPDGKALAFFAGDALKRVAFAGGAAHVLAQAPQGAGGTWTPGTILFAPHWQGGLHRLADTGGTPSALDAASEAPTERHFVHPHFLPDGVHFTAIGVGGSRGVYIGSLDAPERLQRLFAVDTWWARAAAGHLLYLQGRRLMGRPFDVTRRAFSGPEFKIADPAGPFSVGADGTIVYVEPPPLARLVWMTREGNATALPLPPAEVVGISMSPSGRRTAVWIRDDGGNVDLWEVDLTDGTLARLTTHPSQDSDAVWSPDERRIAFTSTRLSRWAVFVKDLASGAETVVHAPPEHSVVDGWTPDGQHLIVRMVDGPGFLVPVKGNGTARMIIDTPYVEDEHHVSPDGRWIAYNSNESGSWEVYIASFPAFAEKRQVSRGGGVQPLWRADGRELFFLSPAGAMMAVTVGHSEGIDASPPRRLFATGVDPSPELPQYAVTPDGRRFLVLDRGERGPDSLHVLLNWLNAADAPAR